MIIIKPKNLKELIKNGLLKKSEVKTIKKKFKKENIALFNKQHKNFINSYIIVADNKELANKAIKFLGMAKQFIGINKELEIKNQQ